jgi:DNA-binding transcriptional LysR family regulator
LFDRVGRWLVLTTEGEQLLESCRSVLRDAQALSEHAQQLRRGDAGVLRVVAAARISDDVLEISPSVRAALSERRGEIDRIVRRRPGYG